jgi:hypothetical protein
MWHNPLISDSRRGVAHDPFGPFDNVATGSPSILSGIHIDKQEAPSISPHMTNHWPNIA